jgi:hypothetical protein
LEEENGIFWRKGQLVKEIVNIEVRGLFGKQ